jgi:hypothetical protein
VEGGDCVLIWGNTPECTYRNREISQKFRTNSPRFEMWILDIRQKGGSATELGNTWVPLRSISITFEPKLRFANLMCDRASYMKMTRGTNLMQQLWFIIINISTYVSGIYMPIFRITGCMLLHMVFSTRCCGCGPEEPVCSLVHCEQDYTPAPQDHSHNT